MESSAMNARPLAAPCSLTCFKIKIFFPARAESFTVATTFPTTRASRIRVSSSRMIQLERVDDTDNRRVYRMILEARGHSGRASGYAYHSFAGAGSNCVDSNHVPCLRAAFGIDGLDQKELPPFQLFVFAGGNDCSRNTPEYHSV